MTEAKVEKIEDGVVVSLAYTLTSGDEMVEQVKADDPLDYLHGHENIVPGLEEALTGKKIGDKIKVTLKPEDAYGEYDPEDKESIPRSEFPKNADLEKGMMVLLEDEDGFMFDATVSEITKDEIILDYNPPLAGKTVTYEVDVIALRKAEADELEHGHPHGFDDEFEVDFEIEDYE